MAEIFPLLWLLASHFLVPVMSRSFTIENKCEYPIWPATYANAGSLNPTGFLLEKGKRRTINASSSWIGRIWGRTSCSTNSAGTFSCATGDCSSGKIECRGNVTEPTNVAEFNLSPDGGFDYYDVSVIEGYNLPLLVTPENNKCTSIGCNDTLSEIPVAGALLCTTPRQPERCNRTNYSNAFNSECPQAYSYTYDDAKSTFKCSHSSNFVITFCPSMKIPKRISPLKLKLIFGVSSFLGLIVVVAIVVMVRANRMRKIDQNGQNIEAVVMLKRFNYVQVKKMTKSFANVLGRGGFGTVYKGKLPGSNRDVAVKILKESNGNGEEFINEVASMSRTSHVNIVSLLGFCYEGRRKAIIYEFMPNGSLDKFISEKMSTKMEWKTLYSIAVGVSHGLEYLHNRCVSRIVHFDIKPQNILMDGDFCPKISDFGLAKLCKNNESIMSMLDARGTAGYIAPEVFSKNFGGVSHKSDVYSYGMVVLEMIGARNIEKVGSNGSSMYFPDSIYENLNRGEIMSFLADEITEEEDEKLVKKMLFVGLWCIQTNPFDRPPMRKVVEMLEGSLETLQIPPKPILCLPSITAQDNAAGTQETSSFSKLSQDTLYYVEEAMQDIVEENKDSLRSF